MWPIIIKHRQQLEAAHIFALPKIGRAEAKQDFALADIQPVFELVYTEKDSVTLSVKDDPGEPTNRNANSQRCRYLKCDRLAQFAHGLGRRACRIDGADVEKARFGSFPFVA